MKSHHRCQTQNNSSTSCNLVVERFVINKEPFNKQALRHPWLKRRNENLNNYNIYDDEVGTPLLKKRNKTLIPKGSFKC